MNSSAIAVTNRLVHEIQTARSVDEISSTLGTNPGVLYLHTTDDLGANKTVKFYVDSGRIRMQENDVDSGFLSSQNVTVDLLIFDLVSNPNTGAVTIRLQMSAQSGSLQRTKSFYSTAILRGSY
jgi:hypothetical protein